MRELRATIVKATPMMHVSTLSGCYMGIESSGTLKSQARVCVEAVKSALEKMSWPSRAVEMFERWKELSGGARAARKLLGGD